MKGGKGGTEKIKKDKEAQRNRLIKTDNEGEEEIGRNRETSPKIYLQ